MFTGIVLEIGRLVSRSSCGGVTRLVVDAPRCAPGLVPGDSLAVNGVCLTVARVAGTRVALDVSPETRRVTTVPWWRPGSTLHLEPALRVGDPVGGHFVLGHVDGIGRIASLRGRGRTATMAVTLDAALSAQLVSKGAIAVDGVSLTLDAGPFHGRFTVTLIPHTLLATRFAAARTGERVNIELDILAKTVTRPVTFASILARGWDRTDESGGSRTP